MKKLFIVILAIFALVLSACDNSTNSGSGSGSGSGSSWHDSSGTTQPEKKPEPKVPDGVDYIFPELDGYANSAPAIKDDGDKRYVFYTTNETAFEQGTSIAVRVGEQSAQDGGKYTYGEQSVIMRPGEAGSWDGARIGNADFVAGKFTYNGHEYSKLMVYQATGVDADKRWQIGLAVSDEWTSGWVRVGTKPFVEYDYEAYGDTYGVGNPSVFSVNEKGQVLIFYSYGSSKLTGTRFVEADLSNLDKPVVSGVIAVAGEGLPLDGNPSPIVANADFKYDYESQTVFMIKDGYPYASNDPQTATKVEIAKVKVTDLYRAECAWTNVVSTIDSLELEGWKRVYSACIVSDAYGRIADSAKLEIGFTSNVAMQDLNDTKYEFYSGLNLFTVPDSVREDLA